MFGENEMMTRERWAYLKTLRPGRGEYLHVSAAVRMIPQKNPMLPWIPWTQKPGITYDVGRNKAKRERRAASRALRQRLAP